MKAVNVLVLTGYGLNCDNETAYAFELAGARHGGCTSMP